MMKVTIHLELTVDEDDVEQGDIPDKIRQLCRDAFGEFQAPRRDAKAYVARRYGSGGPYCPEIKVAEVESRVKIARSLSAAVSSSRIDVEPCCPECGATESPRSNSACLVCRVVYQDMMESADAQMGDPTP